MKEGNVLKLIQLALSEIGVRAFRNNVGTGWQGEINNAKAEGERAIFIKHPRPLQAGLCEGSSDLIGWTSIEITPEMIGRKVAVFTAIECKREKTSKKSAQQINFIEAVRAAGGLAGLAISPADAVAIVSQLPGLSGLNLAKKQSVGAY